MKVTVCVKGDELVKGAGKEVFTDVDSVTIEVGHNVFTFAPSLYGLAVEGDVVVHGVQGDIRSVSRLLITAGGSPAVLTCQPLFDLIELAPEQNEGGA
ncbi:MAG TPA: hypothetical protein VMV78_08810 [Thiobacillus sp.]|nr:hypothetical protein [Thiobacillus sp.]